MSNPYISKNKSIIKRLLISFHRKSSHNNRLTILADLFVAIIKKYANENVMIKCLDVGSGDMNIAARIAENFKNIEITCLDINDETNVKTPSTKLVYKQFDGCNIPFSTKEFDFVLFSDVLHHTGNNLTKLISDAGRIGKYVIIKDHFEFGWYSRFMLKFMDVVGNWAYGVEIPEKYFSPTNFNTIISSNNLKIIELNKEIDLYSHLPIVRNILKKHWQFLAVITSL